MLVLGSVLGDLHETILVSKWDVFNKKSQIGPDLIIQVPETYVMMQGSDWYPNRVTS